MSSRPYPARKLPELAAALAIPVASLLTDELVLAEVRVSPETLERVKREGRPAAREVAERLAGNLEWSACPARVPAARRHVARLTY